MTAMLQFPESRSPSRRALLAGAIGGVAAFAARAVGGPPTVDGDNGDPLILGSSTNVALSYTKLAKQDQPGCKALLAGGPYGIAGENDNANPGVLGTTAASTNGIGVRGNIPGTSFASAIAVQGLTAGHYTQVAIDGDATAGLGEGIGVRGRTQNGIGVYGEATGGYALQAMGRAVFSRSGKVTFSTGQASKTISGHALSSASLVLATIQGNVSGTWVRGVSLDVPNSRFTIRLNQAAPSQLKVGWFIVN